MKKILLNVLMAIICIYLTIGVAFATLPGLFGGPTIFLKMLFLWPAIYLK